MNSNSLNISNYGFSVVQIETMSICDMNCKFCAYPKRNDKGQTLPEPTILSVLDSLSADESVKYITFNQLNEPLLDKRIYGFIKYARNQKLKVMLVTNGISFRSKDVISHLVDSNPEYVKVSVQTLNPELFGNARGINYSFQKYKEGIFEFLKAAENGTSKILVDMACNFLSGKKKLKRLLFGLSTGDPSVYNTIDDLRDDIKEFLKELQGYLKSFRLNDKALDHYLDEVKADYLKEPGFKIGENILLKIKPFIYGRKLTEFYPVNSDFGCPSNMLCILASGSVVPCCIAYDDMLCMGNIKEDSLSTILERSADLLNSIRKGTRKGRDLPLACQKCFGAPTKRGAALRQVKNDISRSFIKNKTVKKECCYE